MRNVKLWAALVVLFFSGVAIGVSGTWIFLEHRALGYLSGHGAHLEKVILRRLDRDLDLTDVQKKRIETVLCRTHAELMELRRRNRPERERIIEQGDASIRAELSTGQQKKFDVLLEKMKAFRAKREASFHKGGGPSARGCD